MFTSRLVYKLLYNIVMMYGEILKKSGDEAIVVWWTKVERNLLRIYGFDSNDSFMNQLIWDRALLNGVLCWIKIYNNIICIKRNDFISECSIGYFMSLSIFSICSNISVQITVSNKQDVFVHHVKVFLSHPFILRPPNIFNIPLPSKNISILNHVFPFTYKHCIE